MTDTTKTPEQLAAEKAAADAAKAQAKAEADAKKKAEKAQADAKKAAEKAEKTQAAAKAKEEKTAAEAAAKAKKEAEAKAAKEAKEAEAKAKLEAKAKAKSDAEAAKKAAQMPEQNGVRRPKADGLCGKAWAIFDDVSKKNGVPASIGESMTLATAAGLNESNVRAEYARWRKFNGVTGRVENPTAPKKEAKPAAAPGVTDAGAAAGQAAAQ